MIILSEVASYIHTVPSVPSICGKVRYGSVARILDVRKKKIKKHIGRKKNGRGLVFSTDPVDLLITNRILSSKGEGTGFLPAPWSLCCPNSRDGCGLALWPGNCCWWPGALPLVLCRISRPLASLVAAFWREGSEHVSSTPPPPPPVSWPPPCGR
jgi:hypothetical protein